MVESSVYVYYFNNYDYLEFTIFVKIIGINLLYQNYLFLRIFLYNF